MSLYGSLIRNYCPMAFCAKASFIFVWRRTQAATELFFYTSAQATRKRSMLTCFCSLLRCSVDDPAEEGKKIEYRVWNPFRSKIAAAVLGGVDNIWVKPGAKVLYLGAASGTSVSHVSDIIGPTGVVYAVEFSHRSGRDLINMAKKRTNVVPIVEDARMPLKYRMVRYIFV
jgi:hypothetical protein